MLTIWTPAGATWRGLHERTLEQGESDRFGN
jgi:hypothetical protein